MLYILAMTSTIFVHILVVMCIISELEQTNNEYLKKKIIILFYY